METYWHIVVVIFVGGILYDKIDSQCKRLKRLEAIVDEVVAMALGKEIKKNG